MLLGLNFERNSPTSFGTHRWVGLGRRETMLAETQRPEHVAGQATHEQLTLRGERQEDKVGSSGESMHNVRIHHKDGKIAKYLHKS